jgi:hypothetical protein
MPMRRQFIQTKPEIHDYQPLLFGELVQHLSKTELEQVKETVAKAQNASSVSLDRPKNSGKKR